MPYRKVTRAVPYKHHDPATISGWTVLGLIATAAFAIGVILYFDVAYKLVEFMTK